MKFHNLLTVCFMVGMQTRIIRGAEKCCPSIGCFTDDYPYKGFPLPMCVEKMEPVYKMYTRTNVNNGQIFTHNSSIPIVFGAKKNTVLLIHGWNSNENADWLTQLKDAFLSREDINVVIADWSGGAELAFYPQSASNTRTIGAYSALVFNNLVDNGGAVSEKMWCTGHSLGAHVCGIAGMRTKLGRVTGLDPAGPFFENVDDITVGINPASANYVDIIHTDKIYGTQRNLGHKDFYPNEGENQPGCILFSCNHGRSVDYMIESVQSDCFAARSRCTSHLDIPGSCAKCTCSENTCSYMGYASKKKKVPTATLR